MSSGFREYFFCLKSKQLIQDIDYHFADFMQKLAGEDCSELLFMAAVLLSHAVGDNHTCISLQRICDEKNLGLSEDLELSAKLPTIPEYFVCEKVLYSTSVVGKPGEYCPLVLDDMGRLYLYRYWECEQRLAKFVRDRTCLVDSVDTQLLQAGIKRLFINLGDEIDWQAVATFVAVKNQFAIISGGPGTGKTTTVAKVLLLLLEQDKKQGRRSVINLVAPTGKATMRLQESIARVKAELMVEYPQATDIVEESSTIHRLLGYIPNSLEFKYNAENKLPTDILLVDEASMVSLLLFVRLFSALKSSCRIILLGDKDQLASVESGAVLYDICSISANVNLFTPQFAEQYFAVSGLSLPVDVSLSDSINATVELQKSYRFMAAVGIGALSRAVNLAVSAEDAETCWQQFDKYDDISFVEQLSANSLQKQLFAIAGELWKEYALAVKDADVELCFSILQRFMILAITKHGVYGVGNLNNLCERALRDTGLLDCQGNFYFGRPIMVMVNAYDRRLYNGDVGIVLPNQDGTPMVWFAMGNGEFRSMAIARLPRHETVFAMTVHKSQGSEYDRVLLVLPDKDLPLLSKEILYTGITRAKKEVLIMGTKDIFKNACRRRIVRASGLQDALLSDFIPLGLTKK